MNNLLLIYFENCKPTLPRIDQLYNVRKPVFHLPKINHKFAEQLPDYQVVKLLNKMEALEYLQKYSRIRKKDLVLMLRILSLKHMKFNVI